MSDPMWFKEVPDDQRLTYTINPKPGSLLRAKMVGESISAIADVMRAFGDEDQRGPDFETFLAGIEFYDDGAISFTFAVLPKLEDEAAQ